MTVNRRSSLWYVAFGILAGFLALSPASAQQAQSDPTVGAWKLDLAKSKYTPGPPPKSETRTYQKSGKDGLKGRFDRIDAAGKTITITYDAQYDGKDYPYLGSAEADTIALARIDANTMTSTLKKNGKVVQDSRSVISADGKVRTQTATGTDAKGRKVDNLLVFERM